MPTSEALRAQLALAELEEELVAAKDSGEGPSRELKQRVREAREHYRSIYRSPSTVAGDGTAEPAPVDVSAGVQGGE